MFLYSITVLLHFASTLCLARYSLQTFSNLPLGICRDSVSLSLSFFLPRSLSLSHEVAMRQNYSGRGEERREEESGEGREERGEVRRGEARVRQVFFVPKMQYQLFSFGPITYYTRALRVACHSAGPAIFCSLSSAD